jgi:hypothetical protein
MAVQRLYADFFHFLDQTPPGVDPWEIYQRLYLRPHQRFFTAYQGTFDHLDEPQLAARVRRIKAGDYSQLQALLQVEDPAALAEGALARCRSVLPLTPEPEVYLFVGFFSADGVTLEVDRRPAIALGLERYKDFKDLPLLIAHEYGHCLQRGLPKVSCLPKERPLIAALAAEGLAVLFTEAVYPDLPLHRHIFLSPERLQWCLENQEVLLELAAADLAGPKLVPVFFGPGDPQAGLPPRLGYFVARQMLRHCLTHHGADDFAAVFPGFEVLLRRLTPGDHDLNNEARRP